MKTKNKFLLLSAAFGMTLALGASLGVATGSSPTEAKADSALTTEWPAGAWGTAPYTVTRASEGQVLNVVYTSVAGNSWDCFGFDISADNARKISFVAENKGEATVKLRVDVISGENKVNKYSLVDGSHEGVTTSSDSGTKFEIPASKAVGVEIWYTADITAVTMFADSGNPEDETTHAGNLSFSSLEFSDGYVIGEMTIDCTADNWAYSKHSGEAGEIGQHLSIYYWNSVSGQNAWGSYATTAHGEMLAYVEYNLPFMPTGMKAVLYDARISEEDWAANPWRSGEGVWGYWSGTQDLDFVADANIIIAGGSTADDNYASLSSVVGYAYYEGKCEESGWDWKQLGHLDFVKMNKQMHVEYYTILQITHYEEFLVGVYGTVYGFDRLTISKYLDSSEWISVGDNKNIKYDVDKSIQIAVYFDRNAGTIYFNDPAHAEADEFAQFLLGEDCTETKTNWIFVSMIYEQFVSDEAKAILLETEHVDHKVDTSGEAYFIQAMQRYDYVLERYGTASYPDFIGRVAENKVVPGSLNIIESTDIENNSALFIIIISASAISAACLILVLRKKKQK